MEAFKKCISKKEGKINLVIMGTQANKNKLFTETNTVKVLNEINKLVIVLPNEAKFDGTLDTIVFVVDCNHDEKESLENLT